MSGITKICVRCKENKDVNLFDLGKNRKDGRYPRCKQCRKNYYSQNKEFVVSQVKKRYYSNKKKGIKPKKSPNKAINDRKYYNKNKQDIVDYQRLYRQKRVLDDINYKLARSLRSRLRLAIKGDFKSGSAVGDLGCSIDGLKQHLESLFQPGMSWDNWSFRGWHIDHIVPLASFDLSDREQLLKACHYTNLQPMWGLDNMHKGARF